MRKLKVPDERNEIEYSAQIDGDRQNYHWPVRFDDNGGYLGVTQWHEDGTLERVLLSPRQVQALLAFVEKFS